jgi:2-polyprenyl-6-methoxyphenol hydroxylase-like FAD-dependent oxidoreductase
VKVHLVAALFVLSSRVWAITPFDVDSVQKEYPIPFESISEIHPTDGRKEAVVVGGGPAGLMSALVLEREGFHVVVFEKRPPKYTRLNILSLKIDSEAMLQELGLLEEFRQKVGTPVTARRLLEMRGTPENPTFQVIADEPISHGGPVPKSDFSVENIPERFKTGAQYFVVTAKFESFLANKARDRGIDIINDATVQVEKRGGSYSASARQGDRSIHIENPDMVVLADGGKGGTSSELKPVVEHKDHPSEGERWVFGDVQYSGATGFNTGLIDNTDPSQPRLINVNFDARHKRAGVTVSVSEEPTSKDEIAKIIHHYAEKVYQAENLHEDPKILYTNDSSVMIHNYSSAQFIDRNLISVGDRAGASSPISGMGVTLSTSSYAAGVRDFARALQQPPEIRVREIRCIEDSLQASVAKWLDSAAKAKSAGRMMLIRNSNP